jgi:hypothetical protein
MDCSRREFWAAIYQVESGIRLPAISFPDGSQNTREVAGLCTTKLLLTVKNRNGSLNSGAIFPHYMNKHSGSWLNLNTPQLTVKTFSFWQAST